MSEWMNEWMNEWKNEWINKWMNVEWMNVEVYGTDRGEYKCIAENNAGRIEASATLSVIVR